MDATPQTPVMIAERFLAARRAARAMDGYPGVVPVAVADGYAVQDAMIAATDDRIFAWKVGRINPPQDVAQGANRFAGPVFAGRVVTPADPDSEPAMGVIAGGFGAVEGEYMIRLGTVDPSRRHWTLADAADVIDAVHVGIEIAGSPLASIGTLGPAVTISDLGNNNGLILGPAIPDWRASRYDDWTVVTEIDGVEAGRGTGAGFVDGTIGAVRFLLELLAARGIAIAPGTWVSSGAVSGIHRVTPGQRAVVRFGDHAVVRCAIVAERPAA